MNIKNTLLLNIGYQPVCMLSWKRAICMVILDKVDILESYDRIIRSPSVVFQAPAVLRLKYNNSTISPMKIRFSRANIYARDNKECQYCCKKFKPQNLTLDHVIPKSAGGKTIWTNIVTSCEACNTDKADRTPQQAGMRLANRPSYPSRNLLIDYIDTPDEWANWLI